MGTSVTRTGWIPICPTNLFKTYFKFNNFFNFFLDVINILQAFKPNYSKKKGAAILHSCTQAEGI